MLKAVISYGAVNAKIKALMGKMLTDEDWQRICACQSLDEIGAYLRRCPGWAGAMEGLPALRFSAAQLDSALKTESARQFQRLYRFASGEDRKYLYFAVSRTELTMILSALRRLLSANSLADEAMTTEFFRSKSKIDLKAVAEARDYNTLLSAIRGSMFYDVLQGAPKSPLTGLPDYSAADMLLDLKLRTTIYSYVTRDYSGMEKRQLIRFLGLEADLLNIVHILRLRRFKDSISQAEQLLIPISWRLKRETVKKLAEAATADDAMEVLVQAGWGKYFPDGIGEPERHYRHQTEVFCRKLLRATQPNLCTIQAYLTLKELECDRLVRVVQAVNYGLSPANAL